MKEKYTRPFVVYGYKKDEKNHLISDPYPAEVIKNIFRWRCEGISANMIAERLNDAGILSPAAYKIQNGLPCAKKDNSYWSFGIVLRILRNTIYTGGNGQHHEAIIDQQTFDLVQKLLRYDGNVSLLSGLIICASCGAHMVRKTVPYKDTKYFYYCCPTGKKHGCANPVRINEKNLIDGVTKNFEAHTVDKNVKSLDRNTVLRMIDAITVVSKKEICIKYSSDDTPVCVQL